MKIVKYVCDTDTNMYKKIQNFFKTFCEIFASKDYKSVENYDKCIEHFLTTTGICANVIKRVYEKYPNFMEVINKIKNIKTSLK